MRNLVAFPLLGLAVILQSAVAPQIKLLSGYADLPLVVLAAWSLQDRVESAWHWAGLACVLIAFISKMPWPVYVIGYSAVVFFAQALQRRVWQAPLLAVFSVVFLGTVIVNFLSFSVLSILGTALRLSDVLGLITLPSLLINILLSVPVYLFVRDLSRWVYPSEEYG